MEGPVEGAEPRGGSEAGQYALARDVFQSEKACSLLAQVERDDRKLGYRVRVRVIRGGPNWRVEAGLFARRLPLFPRLQMSAGVKSSGAGMQAAHGNRTAFQELFERVMRPLHLAVLVEGMHERALQRELEKFRGQGGKAHDLNIDADASVSNLIATASLSSGFRSSMSGTASTERTISNEATISDENVLPQSMKVYSLASNDLGELDLPGYEDFEFMAWRDVLEGPRAPTEMRLPKAVGPDGRRSSVAHVLAKLLVSFRIDNGDWAAAPDFSIPPFVKLHYSPNIGQLVTLTLQGDEDTCSKDDDVGNNLDGYMDFCRNRWGRHHAVRSVRPVLIEGEDSRTNIEVGVLVYTKAQGPRDAGRETYPVVGYMQWSVLSFDVLTTYFDDEHHGLRRIRELIDCVDGLGKPKYAKAVIKEIVDGEKDTTAIALFLFGHAWNATKRWSRLVNTRNIRGQPRLRSDGQEFRMNSQVTCESAKIGTGRRSKGQSIFEHILLSTPYDLFKARCPEFLPSLFFGDRDLLPVSGAYGRRAGWQGGGPPGPSGGNDDGSGQGGSLSGDRGGPHAGGGARWESGRKAPPKRKQMGGDFRPRKHPLSSTANGMPEANESGLGANADANNRMTRMYTPVIVAGLMNTPGDSVHDEHANPTASTTILTEPEFPAGVQNADGDDFVDDFIRNNFRQSSLFELISGNSRLGSVDAHVAYLYDQREPLDTERT